jgi:hypothetical protein
MNARDWKFPMSCPACKAIAGNPYTARTDTGQLVIELRCGECLHEWAISAPSPSVVLKTSLDRRRWPRAQSGG